MLTDLYYIYILMGRQYIREDVELVQSFDTIPSDKNMPFRLVLQSGCVSERVGFCFCGTGLRKDVVPSKIPLFRWKMNVLNMTRLLIKRVKSIVIQPC